MKVRRAKPEDARGIAEMYHRAVHELATDAYDDDILDVWGPPADDERVEKWADHLERDDERDDAVAFVAVDDRVLGFADVDPDEEYLRAVYIDPEMSRRGLGRALLRQAEWAATQAGAERLTLDASLNSVEFYEKNGYERIEEGTHEIADGVEMACVHMLKEFPGA